MIRRRGYAEMKSPSKNAIHTRHPNGHLKQGLGIFGRMKGAFLRYMERNNGLCLRIKDAFPA